MPVLLLPIALGLVSSFLSPQAQTAPLYKVTKTEKVGGEGGFDYVYADSVGRKLYVARGGSKPRVSAFNLDTLAPAGEISGTNTRGAAVDAKSLTDSLRAVRLRCGTAKLLLQSKQSKSKAAQTEF